MRIAIEARALSRQGGGVKTYINNLLSSLLKLSNDEIYVLYDNEKPRGTYPESKEVVISRGNDIFLNWWLNKKVPRVLKKINPAVTHFTKAALPKRIELPTVVTIYDVIPMLYPESQKLSGRIYWPRALRNAALRSDHILTISEASKRDIIKLFGTSPERITVTPLAIDTDHFRPLDQSQVDKVRQTYKLPQKYILYVGTIEPRKNVPALIRAFAAAANNIEHDLVIAGAFYKGEEQVAKAIQESKIPDRIHLLDFVSQKDLPGLYNGAELFAWPSIYEGWGFPPQEAMACGVPVLVSEGGALPEVVGDAGVTVSFHKDNISARTRDHDFEKEFAEQITRILNDELLAKSMREKGLVRAQNNTWDSVAEKTMAVYKKVVK